MKKMIQAARFSIRGKLFVSYLAVFSLPFLLLLGVHLNIVISESKQHVTFSSHKALQEMSSYLEYKAYSITEVLNIIAFDEGIQAIVRADKERYHDIDLWAHDANRIAKVLNLVRYNQKMITMQLYMRGGLAGQPGNQDYLRMENLYGLKWFNAYAASDGVYAWIPSKAMDVQSSSDHISVLRKIPEPNNFRLFNGVVRAQIPQSSVQSILDYAIITPSSSAIVLNDYGHVLSKSSTFIYNDQQIKELLALAKGNNAKGQFWEETLSHSGEQVLLGLQSIPMTDMQLLMIVPYVEIVSAADKSLKNLVIIFLIIASLILPLSYVVSGSATKRIRQLTTYLQRAKRGTFEYVPSSSKQDEIGELIHNYNVMIQNISELMNDKYAMGQEIKSRELQALQAQINPHFLYNTLDMINIMAIESKAKDISSVVNKLAIFYRLSLSNGNEIVTLENEIRHVEVYVQIQNMRFDEGIDLIIDAEEEALGCEVPKIMLQPLVENAILHGILETDSESGAIRLSVRREGTHVVIQLADNGVGMDGNTLHALMRGGAMKRSGGYAVRNLQERIRLLYGDEYGLIYESEQGKGTNVTIRIPFEKTKKNAD